MIFTLRESASKMHFSLDNISKRLYIWITLRFLRGPQISDVRENHSMKNATKKAVKKAPAKKAAPKKKK